MLKWLGGGGNTSSGASGSSGGGNGSDNFTHVGKVFTVNEYQVVVEELIAEGGFAVVYRAKSSKGRTYALKRMAVNNAQDLYLARQEIAITKALSDCPNSVTYISSFVRAISPDIHEVLILMELYTGQSVVDLLNSRLAKKQALSEREVLKIFSDIAVAVGRLHHRTKPIIHRDLKIENILSDARGNYILCDYGSCTVRTMHPETMGAAECEDEIARFTTLSYRSPEMVSLYSGKTISTKSDIWALGCLLYKLCFMTTPFGEQPLAIVSAQFSVPQNSQYSDQLHSLICYMLEADPEKRPTIWQVNEVACRQLGQPNNIPNVFRSPKPPVILPSAKRLNDDKAATPPSSEVKSKPMNQSTPSNPKSRVAVVTTTSISSRERPRARGIGQNLSSASGTTSSFSRHNGSSVHQSHLSSVPYNNERHQYLRAPSELGERAASMDSGLDMFGAVPFNKPGQQVSSVDKSPASPTASSFTDLRRDLFGSTPFTASFTSSPSRTAQPISHSRPSPTSQIVDEFGAPPFVTCS